jgi:hypothetical protein
MTVHIPDPGKTSCSFLDKSTGEPRVLLAIKENVIGTNWSPTTLAELTTADFSSKGQEVAIRLASHPHFFGEKLSFTVFTTGDGSEGCFPIWLERPRLECFVTAPPVPTGECYPFAGSKQCEPATGDNVHKWGDFGLFWGPDRLRCAAACKAKAVEVGKEGCCGLYVDSWDGWCQFHAGSKSTIPASSDHWAAVDCAA